MKISIYKKEKEYILDDNLGNFNLIDIELELFEQYKKINKQKLAIQEILKIKYDKLINNVNVS